MTPSYRPTLVALTTAERHNFKKTEYERAKLPEPHIYTHLCTSRRLNRWS